MTSASFVLNWQNGGQMDSAKVEAALQASAQDIGN